MNTYQEKKQARIDRFLALADSIGTKSDSAYNKAASMASMIPFGQPILIGHHSEGRDRRYRARIERLFGNSFELQDKAEYYRSKALSAQNNNAISGDDPEAIQKLREKIESIKANNEASKLANKALRKASTPLEKIEAIMIAIPDRDKALKHLEFAQKWPMYEQFRTTGNTAEIRRCEQRIEQLEKRKTLHTDEKIIGEVRIVNNIEENRLQVFFPGKPQSEIIQELKRSGFRWSPSNGCWQAFRKQWNLQNAIEIARKVA